jgi:chemotaxis methyl-accepting protein methylase
MAIVRHARPELASVDYALWRELIEARCGIDYDESRTNYLARRLWDRMQVLGMTSYRDYYDFLAHHRRGRDEWRGLLEDLVNNQTSFFRHAASFAALAEHVLPGLVASKGERGGTINIWSAGCSTGEEAYSLAITALEHRERFPVAVWASDISEAALGRARRAEYAAHTLRDVPEALRSRYVEHRAGDAANVYRMTEDVTRLVRFGCFNFREPDPSAFHDMDVIFCQNVMIYFRPGLRLRVVRELCERLAPGGCLFLAPGELVGLAVPGVENVRYRECLVYRRTA